MTVKERLLQEIAEMSDESLAELLDVALLIKQRQDEEEISEEEKANIIQARLAYEAGDYLTLEEFENTLPDSTPAPDRKKSRVKALQGWFEKTTPAPADFDDDQAK
jgi:hypothetical protein